MIASFSNLQPNESTERQPRDPSQEEIARRTEMIRRGWSESQKKRRRVHPAGQDRWTPPVINVSDLVSDQ